MKKIACILLGCAMVFGLVACTPPKNVDKNTEDTERVEETEKETDEVVEEPVETSDEAKDTTMNEDVIPEGHFDEDGDDEKDPARHDVLPYDTDLYKDTEDTHYGEDGSDAEHIVEEFAEDYGRKDTPDGK